MIFQLYTIIVKYRDKEVSILKNQAGSTGKVLPSSRTGVEIASRAQEVVMERREMKSEDKTVNTIKRSCVCDKLDNREPNTDLVNQVLLNQRITSDSAIEEIILDLSEFSGMSEVSSGMLGTQNTYGLLAKYERNTLVVVAGHSLGKFLFKGYYFEEVTTAKAVREVVSNSVNALEAASNLTYMLAVLNARESERSCG